VSIYSGIRTRSGRCANSTFSGSTCAISGIRITSLRASLMDTDVTWTAPETALWSMGEVSSAIVCVCVPTLRSLVTHSYKPWRLHEAKEATGSKGSIGRWRNQLSNEIDHLETQPSVHSSANVGDERLISEISLDIIIQKPSSYHLPESGREPNTLNII
jgi:hypothetical protein